jgi:hypothetical protein
MTVGMFSNRVLGLFCVLAVGYVLYERRRKNALKRVLTEQPGQEEEADALEEKKMMMV